MAHAPGYQATDAVVSPNFSIFSPSVSRVRSSEAAADDGPDGSSSVQHDMATNHSSEYASERDPLLHGKRKKPFYRARPLW